MKCPYCGEVDSKVIDSRPTEDGEKIRRRRECLNCKKRFTTYEIVETVPLMVVKKDRSREVFDLAMQELKQMDDVAYVRFASVYRQFSDVNTFMEELKDMLDSRSKSAEK